MFFQIANHLEATLCNEYRYCRLPGMAVSKCAATPDPLHPFHFDRNTGTCVDNTGFARLPSCDPSKGGANVDPCKVAPATFVGNIGATSPPSDVPAGTIADCDKWYFCFESETYDSGTCPCGQIFDSASNPCKIIDATLTPQVSCTPSAAAPTTPTTCPTTFQDSLTSRHLRRENRNLFL